MPGKTVLVCPTEAEQAALATLSFAKAADLIPF